MLIFCDFIQVYVFTTNHHLYGKNTLVRSFTRFHKHVTFTPWYGQLLLGNTLKAENSPGKEGIVRLPCL